MISYVAKTASASNATAGDRHRWPALAPFRSERLSELWGDSRNSDLAFLLYDPAPTSTAAEEALMDLTEEAFRLSPPPVFRRLDLEAGVGAAMAGGKAGGGGRRLFVVRKGSDEVEDVAREGGGEVEDRAGFVRAFKEYMQRQEKPLIKAEENPQSGDSEKRQKTASSGGAKQVCRIDFGNDNSSNYGIELVEYLRELN